MSDNYEPRFNTYLTPEQAWEQMKAQGLSMPPWMETLLDREKPEAERKTRMIEGGAFAFDQVNDRPIWGRPDEVAWIEGEPVLIVGPTGVGHTTLLQRLMLARIGIGNEVLGLPVERSDKPVLYVAADRPRQARRSIRRMVNEAEHRQILTERLFVWEGPPDFDIARSPKGLMEWATNLEVGTVFIDALKDVAAKLPDDETGGGVVKAWNYLLAEGIEVVAAHHQRKAQEGNRKPKALDDVYGSGLITMGAGSVLLLWGEAGNPVVELSSLKLAAGEVGPFEIVLDFDTGAVTVVEGTDPLAILQAAPRGLTAQEGAVRHYGITEPKKGQVVKARRAFDRLVTRGLATYREGARIRGAVTEPGRYFAIPPGGLQEPIE